MSPSHLPCLSRQLLPSLVSLHSAAATGPHRPLLFQRLKTFPTQLAHSPKRSHLSPARPERQTTSLSGMERSTYPLKRRAKGRESSPPAGVRLFVAHLLSRISTQSLRVPPASSLPSAPGRSLRFSPPRVIYLCVHQCRPICRLGTRTLLPRARRSIRPSRPSVPRPLAENPLPLLALVPDPLALYSLHLPQKLPASYSTVRKIEGQAGAFLVHRLRPGRCIPSHRSMSKNAIVWLLLKERKRRRPTSLGRQYRLVIPPQIFVFRCPSVVQRADRC